MNFYVQILLGNIKTNLKRLNTALKEVVQTKILPQNLFIKRLIEGKIDFFKHEIYRLEILLIC